MDTLHFCDFNNPTFLFFSEKVPPFIYYSHFPILIISMVIGIYLFFKNFKGLSNQLILAITTFFSIWVLLDSIFWASNRGDVIMFVWAIQILIEPLVHMCAFYLVYITLYNKDLPLSYQLFLIISYLPLIIFTPTDFMLTSFDVNNCLSNESIYSYYSYIIEIIYTLCLVFIGAKKYFNEKEKVARSKILFLVLGVLILLCGFSWGAIVGSFTDDWNLAQFGLFGMPIFIAFLLYNIVNFNLFDLKLIGRNVLVFVLWVLIGSLIVITDITINHIVTGITFIISIILGIIIIRTNNKEIKKLYELEKKSRRELEKLAETKDQFIMIAQHNLRIPITNIINKLDLLSKNGNRIDPESQRNISDAVTSVKHLQDIADDFKNIAQMKVGSQILNLSRTSMLPLLTDILKELAVDIENMKITVTYPTTPQDWPVLNIDPRKIRDVLLVIMENALRYNTLGGTITIQTKTENDLFTMILENTGIGITTEEMNSMSEKSFYRSIRSKELNPTGMGIGLSLSRGIVAAHHGTLLLSSKGEHMGALVTLSLPLDFIKNLESKNT